MHEKPFHLQDFYVNFRTAKHGLRIHLLQLNSKLIRFGDLVNLILLSNLMEFCDAYVFKILKVPCGCLSSFLTAYFCRGLSQLLSTESQLELDMEYTENFTVEAY